MWTIILSTGLDLLTFPLPSHPLTRLTEASLVLPLEPPLMFMLAWTADILTTMPFFPQTLLHLQAYQMKSLPGHQDFQVPQSAIPREL